LRISELIKYSKKIIGDRMHMDYFSRLAGSVIYRQDIDKITRDEIEHMQRALLVNGIYSQLQVTTKEYLLRLLAEYSKVKRENRRTNLLLLIATILTTTLTGAMLRGKDPFLSFENLSYGIPYCLSIMVILTAHEFGDYFYALKHRIYATLPYFIPFFIPAFSFGTLGAFIKMKSPIPNKQALFDVGVAGPLAGFVMSLFFLALGFSQLPDAEGVRQYVSQIHPWSESGEGALTLGNSILFDYIRNMMGGTHLPMYEIYHFPFIFAGWTGLLVTSLNLMPIGQLDGGHISYALLGRKARFVALGAFISLAGLNLYSTNWLLWTILILIVIRLKHPPTLNDGTKLDTTRRILAWSSYLIFITCFPPKPIYFP
jgi:membrane-associated protease RseP (regulator of RpoE activity)